MKEVDFEVGFAFPLVEFGRILRIADNLDHTDRDHVSFRKEFLSRQEKRIVNIEGEVLTVLLWASLPDGKEIDFLKGLLLQLSVFDFIAISSDGSLEHKSAGTRVFGLKHSIRICR